MEQAKTRKFPIFVDSGSRSKDRSEGDAGGKNKSGKQKSDQSGGKGGVWAYLAIASIPLVLVLGNSMIVPVLPKMEEELGISQFQSSLTITLFSVTAGLFIPILGFLSDRFGTRKGIIIPCLIVYGAAGILAGFGAVWKSYGIVILARAIQGLGAAGTAPIAMALVGDLYKGAKESRVLGLLEASNGTGKVLSPIIGSALALIVWFAPFFAFPVFCALGLIAVIFLIKEPKEKQKGKPLGPYLKKLGEIFKQKGRWLVTSFFAGSLGLFILFGILFYLSNILEEDPFNIKGVTKGLILAIPLLGMVATAYITGSIIKKNGVLMRWLMNIGLLLMTITLGLATLFADSLWLLIGLITISSIGTGFLLPCLNTLITGSVQRSERGAITSIYNSLRFLGVAAGPPLFDWLMNRSHQIVFITVSSLSLLTLLLVFFLIKPSKQVS